MARQKISEYRTKQLLYTQLGSTYTGIEVTPETPFHSDSLSDTVRQWVAKVDQGIKKRGKLGLMKAGLSANEINGYLQKWQNSGYEYFIIEPMLPHNEADEHYLSLERTGDGVRLLHSLKGGMEIERHADSIDGYILQADTVTEVSGQSGIAADTLKALLHFFNRNHFSFLEINPYLVKDGRFVALDAAGFVDDAAQLLVRGAWNETDFRRHAARRRLSQQEENVLRLAASSQASFRYELINPNGAVFMLLSGGGASVVLADELYNRGAGKLLANYGEYSGNPNEEETYAYTTQIIESLLSSSAPQRSLVIAGGVANFTDIRATFLGIRRALAERTEELQAAGVKVHIRRGGPHEAEALQMMEQFLSTHHLLGSIGGSKLVITDVIDRALKGVA